MNNNSDTKSSTNTAGPKRPFAFIDTITSRLPMGPRKKSKPNVEAKTKKDSRPAEPPTPSQSSKSTPDILPSESAEQPTAQVATPKPIDIPPSQSLPPSTASNDLRSATPRTPNSSLTQASLGNRKSWYGSLKGSLKAKPVAEVAKDHVPASPALSSSLRAFEGERRSSAASIAASSPRRYMSGSQTPQSKAPASISVSNLSVAFDQTSEDKGRKAPMSDASDPEAKRAKATVPDPPLPPTPPIEKKKDKADQGPRKDQQLNSGGWLGGWWSRPDGYVEETDAVSKEEIPAEAQRMPLPETPIDEGKQPQPTGASPVGPTPLSAHDGSEDVSKKPQMGANKGYFSPSAWFGPWSTRQNSQSEGSKQDVVISDATAVPSSSNASVQLSPPTKPAEPASPNSKIASVNSGNPVKGSYLSSPWAYFYRGSPEGDNGNANKQVGELAVADTPSQNHPEAAQFNQQEEPLPQEPPKEAVKASAKSKLGSLRGRKREEDKEPISEASTPSKVTPSGSPTRKPETLAAVVKSAVRESKKDKNLLLPEFRGTYSLQQQRSLWDQVRRYVLGSNECTSDARLHITPTPPRIKKAVAIGVHGFFPTAIFQKILGQPTGTSIRFANNAEQAIRNWTNEQGYECEIEKIALQGEGFIADRVDVLWELLLNGVEHIRHADYIMVACHSQGVPVAVMLVAKLIAFGCVSSARIGICAMAGINLGPFAEYKTKWFGGSALELFDFGNPSSKVSKMYQQALGEVLRFGTRIVYVGSIDDQLVSMESSTFSTLTHPLIYRAVFVDGRLHNSDFLSNLIGFTLKLRNLGLSDHGLIRELSPAVAGSLYSGEGHSSLYHHLPVYELAVKHSLETTSLGKSVDPVMKKYEGPLGTKDPNPYFLPWAMRGILEEPVVKKELGEEIEELLRLFEEWRPVSKGLKDVKFRLEAVRSKL